MLLFQAIGSLPWVRKDRSLTILLYHTAPARNTRKGRGSTRQWLFMGTGISPAWQALPSYRAAQLLAGHIVQSDYTKGVFRLPDQARSLLGSVAFLCQGSGLCPTMGPGSR